MATSFKLKAVQELRAAKKIEREAARVDTKKLKEKYPDIYNECLKPSSSIIIERHTEPLLWHSRTLMTDIPIADIAKRHGFYGINLHIYWQSIA